MPTLEITTMVGCPLRCTYCPQDALRSAYGKATKYLSLGDFKAVLAKVPKYVRIDFSGMSEPWANPAASDMLEHALTEGFNVAIYTTLYGMKDPGRVVGLLEAHASQVEELVLHLPDRNGVMRGYRPSEGYAMALEAFLGLKQGGTLREVRLMTMDRAGEAHPSIQNLVGQCDEWEGLTRAGNLRVEGDAPLGETPRHGTVVGCAFTHAYDQNVLLPNGDVLLCCMDYGRKHRIGNLLTDDYLDLFASDGMRAVVVENMKPGFSDRSACKSCVRAKCFAVEPGDHQTWRAA